MELRPKNQRLASALALSLVAVAGLTFTSSATAQENPQQQTGSRYQVLIPNLESAGGANGNFGKKVAEELRKEIEKLDTHTPVSKKDLQETLRKYKLKEDELDCIKSRQLAVQIGAELVMCGRYEEASGGMQVAASFVGARTGETYEIPPFTSGDPKQAAQQIFTSFQGYVSQLRLLSFCSDYLQSQQWQNALQNCNEALKVNPTSATGLYGRARALMEMDSIQAAYESFVRIIQSNPMHQEALRAAGVVAARLEKPEESRQHFRQYLELNPGDASVRLQIASEASKAGDPEGALRIVEEGIRADTTGNPSLDLLMFGGHWALAAAQKILQDNMDAVREGNRPPKSDSLAAVALRYYQQLYAKAPDQTDPGVIRNMMIVLTQQQKAAEAAELGAKAVAAKPDDAVLWSVYADALEASGRFDEALAALDKAAAADKDGSVPVFAKRGQWLAQRGRIDEAKTALREAISRGKVKPDDAANVVFAAGYERFQKNQHDVALDYFSAVRDLAEAPDIKGMANFWTGYIHFQRGSAIARDAKTAAALRPAVPHFRRALEFFNGADAYAAKQSSIRSQIQQMADYARQVIDSAAKAGR